MNPLEYLLIASLVYSAYKLGELRALTSFTDVAERLIYNTEKAVDYCHELEKACNEVRYPTLANPEE